MLMIIPQMVIPDWVVWLYVPVIIWSLAWKGIALWKAGKNNQPAWFVAMLLVNTVGILEIIYIAFFQSNKKRRK